MQISERSTGGILNEHSMGVRMSLGGHEPAMPPSPFFIGRDFSDRVAGHKMKKLIMARWRSPEPSTHDKCRLYLVSSAVRSTSSIRMAC